MKTMEAHDSTEENKTWQHLARHDDDPALIMPGTAGNISTPPNTNADSENSIHSLHDRIDDEDRDEDEDEENDDEEIHKSDWGDVDPQHNPMAPRSPMDPSAPGSAV